MARGGMSHRAFYELNEPYRDHLDRVRTIVQRHADRHIEGCSRVISSRIPMDAMRKFVCLRVHGLVDENMLQESFVRKEILHGLVAYYGHGVDRFQPGMGGQSWERLKGPMFKHPGLFWEDAFMESLLLLALSNPKEHHLRDIHRAPSRADYYEKIDFIIVAGRGYSGMQHRPDVADLQFYKNIDPTINIGIQLTCGAGHNRKVNEMVHKKQNTPPDIISEDRSDPFESYFSDGGAVVSLGGGGAMTPAEIQSIGDEWIQDPKGFLLSNLHINKKKTRDTQRKKRYFSNHAQRLSLIISHMMDLVGEYSQMFTSMQYVDPKHAFLEGDLDTKDSLSPAERVHWKYDQKKKVLHFFVSRYGTKKKHCSGRRILENHPRDHRPIFYELDESYVMKASFVLDENFLQRIYFLYH